MKDEEKEKTVICMWCGEKRERTQDDDPLSAFSICWECYQGPESDEIFSYYYSEE